METEWPVKIWSTLPAMYNEEEIIYHHLDETTRLILWHLTSGMSKPINFQIPITLWFNFNSGVYLTFTRQTYLLNKNKFLFTPNDQFVGGEITYKKSGCILAVKLPPAYIKLLLNGKTWTNNILPNTLLDYTPALRSHLLCLKEQLELTHVDQEIIRHAIEAILYEFRKIITSISNDIDRLPAKKRSTREELYSRLCLVKDHIYTFYNQTLKLQQLSRISFLNPYYLIREYKNMFGLSPGQAIIERRLEVAYELIQHTNKSITEICHEVGYNDISSFSKLFKSRYGKAPIYYRHEEPK